MCPLHRAERAILCPRVAPWGQIWPFWVPKSEQNLKFGALPRPNRCIFSNSDNWFEISLKLCVHRAVNQYNTMKNEVTAKLWINCIFSENGKNRRISTFSTKITFLALNDPIYGRSCSNLVVIMYEQAGKYNVSKIFWGPKFSIFFKKNSIFFLAKYFKMAQNLNNNTSSVPKQKESRFRGTFLA